MAHSSRSGGSPTSRSAYPQRIRPDTIGTLDAKRAYRRLNESLRGPPTENLLGTSGGLGTFYQQTHYNPPMDTGRRNTPPGTRKLFLSSIGMDSAMRPAYYRPPTPERVRFTNEVPPFAHDGPEPHPVISKESKKVFPREDLDVSKRLTKGMFHGEHFPDVEAGLHNVGKSFESTIHTTHPKFDHIAERYHGGKITPASFNTFPKKRDKPVENTEYIMTQFGVKGIGREDAWNIKERQGLFDTTVGSFHTTQFPKVESPPKPRGLKHISQGKPRDDDEKGYMDPENFPRRIERDEMKREKHERHSKVKQQARHEREALRETNQFYSEQKLARGNPKYVHENEKNSRARPVDIKADPLLLKRKAKPKEYHRHPLGDGSGIQVSQEPQQRSGLRTVAPSSVDDVKKGARRDRERDLAEHKSVCPGSQPWDIGIDRWKVAVQLISAGSRRAGTNPEKMFKSSLGWRDADCVHREDLSKILSKHGVEMSERNYEALVSKFSYQKSSMVDWKNICKATISLENGGISSRSIRTDVTENVIRRHSVDLPPNGVYNVPAIPTWRDREKRTNACNDDTFIYSRLGFVSGP